MKRRWVYLLCAAVLFSITGCGDSGASSQAENATVSEQVVADASREEKTEPKYEDVSDDVVLSATEFKNNYPKYLNKKITVKAKVMYEHKITEDSDYGDYGDYYLALECFLPGVYSAENRDVFRDFLLKHGGKEQSESGTISCLKSDGGSTPFVAIKGVCSIINEYPALVNCDSIEEAIYSIDASQIISDYSNNEAGADEKYMNQDPTITGNVYKVEKSTFSSEPGVYCVRIGYDYSGSLSSYFSDSSEISSLSVGDEVTISGSCIGVYVNHPCMKNCTVVN